MKNSFKFTVIAALAFLIGAATSNFAVSDVPSNYKVAIVDVQKVVTSSSQAKSLKEEHKKKGAELSKFIATAKAAIDKESDADKKKSLEAKYNKEFQAKREAIAKSYEAKLLAIDKDITDVINSQAKKDGYDLVLAKGVVLSGGIDITDSIAKQIK